MISGEKKSVTGSNVPELNGYIMETPIPRTFTSDYAKKETKQDHKNKGREWQLGAIAKGSL
ncbi:unnamed protein product [Prunus armeniaca]|uniref:Uncharacterized protein n=1 Tax=Prunus armeniaca TaxID=36596 RepID=A0A6J5UAV9_PRUAR|nr:unnamed protein product [Prunus armeniaca]CAB4303961.1 unnamed protein product [Prunus armeniaca]